MRVTDRTDAVTDSSVKEMTSVEAEASIRTEVVEAEEVAVVMMITTEEEVEEVVEAMMTEDEVEEEIEEEMTEDITIMMTSEAPAEAEEGGEVEEEIMMEREVIDTDTMISITTKQMI